MSRDEILKYKGNEIENFKKLNNILTQPLNEKTYIESDEYGYGKKYIGKKINNKYEGRGILYDNKGNIIFNGYFKNGNYEGFGILYDEYHMIYNGYFKDNQYSGIGILYSDNKIKYEGNFLNGEYNGVGIEYLKNGKRKAKYKDGKILKECYGVLYDKNNKEIYTGLLKEQKPKNAKSATIYDDNLNIIYIGDFIDFQYNGKGQLYYNKKYNQKEEKIYFEGVFEKDKFIKGTLFSPDGYKVYDGEFCNNIPKEGKNISIYNINGFIDYIGDLLDGKYNGNGKLFLTRDYYENELIYEGQFKNGLYHGFGKGKQFQDKYSEFLYEGNFINGKMEGKGIIYYEDEKTIFYNGEFKNNEIYGKGIIYYFNNSKKIKGIFKTINKCKGIYYNPKGEKIYEGIIINEIPENWDNAIIYDNYCLKIYEGKIKKGAYNGKGIEFSDSVNNLKLHEGNFINNYCIVPDYKLNDTSINLTCVSTGVTGKTCLLFRLKENYFKKDNLLATIGVDFMVLEFKFNDKDYKIKIWDTNGSERFRAITSSYLRNANLILYTFDLTDLETFHEEFIDYIKTNAPKEVLIYLVGNRLDLINENNINNLSIIREKAKFLIENKKINNYFEVSAKNNRGIDYLKKNIKWYILRDANCH